MNKFLIVVSSFFVLSSMDCSAAVYKGQKEYIKKCVICHHAGQEFIATKRKREWTSLMRNSGEALAQIHIESKNKKAEPSVEYFQSDDFVSNSKHLKDFMKEYAQDSGNVPACN